MTTTPGVDIYFEDHKESSDLGRRAVRGGIVSVAMQYGNGVLQIIAAVVLARLLTPGDFGLVAIVTVLTSFASVLIDFGLGDATTQRKRITPNQISSLFWLSVAVGSAVAVLLAACSPLIATIYRQPSLQPIALCASITFVLWGASNQHLALLRRTMQFGRIARIQIFGSLVGIVTAIVMAIYGYGYWALVARPIANGLCVVAGAWLGCRWRPGRPSVDPEVKSMVRFGLHVVSFSVTHTMARSVDRIALGLFYRPELVGYYQNAITLYESSLFQVFSQVHTVGSAALSKLQSRPDALRQKYAAALSALAFFVMPAAAILSVTGEDVAVILLGEKWRMAGWLLRIIALRGIFQLVEMSQGWLHLSIGRADRWRNWGLVSLAVQIVTVLAGLPFGATGVAVGGVVASLLIAVPSISYAGRPIGIGSTIVMRAVGPQLIGALGTAAAGWLLQTTVSGHWPAVLRIVSSAAFCAGIYLIVVVGLFGLREPIRVARSVVMPRLRRSR